MPVVASAAASSVLRPLLCGTGVSLTVWAQYGVAVYLHSGDGISVALTEPRASRLPFAVRLLAPPAIAALRHVQPGAAATAGRGLISLPGLIIEVRRWWQPAPSLAAICTDALHRRAEELAALLSPTSSSGSAALGAALLAGDSAAVIEAADDLIGAGPGSTPAGDDLIAGVLVTLALLAPVNADAAVAHERIGRPLARHTIQAARGRTTQLSVALLSSAAAGQPCGEVADLLRALGGRIPLRPAVDALLAVGHTSGTELAHGVLAAVNAIAMRGRAAA